MDESALQSAIAAVPAGGWAVGVSGGADSAALLSLLRRRSDLSPVVVHLNHQTRGQASLDDARFVENLAARWNLPCVIAMRSAVEAEMTALPTNPSARFRAARLVLFKQVVTTQNLAGVILAHHADDQAETILHRLMRGSGTMGLAGMRPCTRIGGMIVRRPLLGVRRDQLRDWLKRNGQGWREDESNQSPTYLRNRLRRLLRMNPPLTGELLSLGEACAELRDWVREHSPPLEASFPIDRLRQLPRLLAEEAAKHWLSDRGSPNNKLIPAVVQHLLEMADDAASPSRRHFPGGLLVRRQKGMIFVE